MSEASTVRYRIDARDRIVWFDPAFRAFAVDNGDPDLPVRVLGTPLWQHLEGSGVQQLWVTIVSRARKHGALAVPFRCDSSDTRRHMELRLLPEPDGSVLFEGERLREEVVTQLAPALPVPGPRVITSCAWCRRVLADGWVEPEEAVARADLFGVQHDIRVTHGICPACLVHIEDAVGDAAKGVVRPRRER